MDKKKIYNEGSPKDMAHLSYKRAVVCKKLTDDWILHVTNKFFLKQRDVCILCTLETEVMATRLPSLEKKIRVQ